MNNSKTLLTVTAIMLALVGVGWLVAPELFYSSFFGWTPNGNLLFMARRYAAYVLGLTVIVWMARSAANTQARRAVMMGTFVTVGLTGLTSLYGVLSNTIGPLGWGAAVPELLLAVWFAYALFVKPEARAD